MTVHFHLTSHASNMPILAILTAHNEVWSKDLIVFMLAWQASSLASDRLPRFSIFAGDEGRENNADKPDTVDSTISEVVRASASAWLISTASMFRHYVSFVRTSAYGMSPYLYLILTPPQRILKIVSAMSMSCLPPLPSAQFQNKCLTLTALTAMRLLAQDAKLTSSVR